MNRYTPRHFRIQELVTPYVFNRLGELSLIVMDDRILRALDAIRDLFGSPVIVNNWHIGGGFDQRGFRDDGDVGAKLSQHRFGRAIDFDVVGIHDANKVRATIIDAWPHIEALQGITRIESGVDWCHIDSACIQTPRGPIIFKG